MSTLLDTTNWVSYPFSVEGIEFVAKLDPQGSFYSQIEALPVGLFASWNKDMVSQIIGNPALFSHEELLSELDRVNDGASQALICLA